MELDEANAEKERLQRNANGGAGNVADAKALAVVRVECLDNSSLYQAFTIHALPIHFVNLNCLHHVCCTHFGITSWA